MSIKNNQKIKYWPLLWLIVTRLLFCKGVERLWANLRQSGVLFAISCVINSENAAGAKSRLNMRIYTLLSVITLKALITYDKNQGRDALNIEKALKRLTDPFLAPSVRFETALNHLRQSKKPPVKLANSVCKVNS